VELDSAEVQVNVDRVKQVHPLLLANIDTFLKALGEA
jgi:hypothetical protein